MTHEQTTIHLIRHGVTRANRENRFAGRTAEPLHPEGVEQIGRLAEEFQDREIARIITGPLPRTRQTAEIIARRLDVSAGVAGELNDIRIPHWDGLTKEEIRRNFGPQYPTWLDHPAGFALPGCETLAEVQQRGVRCVERLFADYQGETLLVVSHLVVLRCLILHYRGQPLSDYRSIKVANGEIITLLRTADGETSVCWERRNVTI